MSVMAPAGFLEESIAVVAAAPDYAALNATYAERITALILNGGTMRDLRKIAQVWRDRSDQLLNEAMEGDQP